MDIALDIFYLKAGQFSCGGYLWPGVRIYVNVYLFVYSALQKFTMFTKLVNKICSGEQLLEAGEFLKVTFLTRSFYIVIGQFSKYISL